MNDIGWCPTLQASSDVQWEPSDKIQARVETLQAVWSVGGPGSQRDILLEQPVICRFDMRLAEVQQYGQMDDTSHALVNSPLSEDKMIPITGRSN